MPPDSDSGRNALETFRQAARHPEPDEGVVGLFAYYESGCAAHELTPLPLDQDDLATRGEAPEPARVRALRQRLRRLGYAVVESEATEPDAWTPGLAAALREFQREAGLVDHGELDVSTWDRLRELFDFETELHTDWCFEAGAARPPLVRAVRLRLAVYGFAIGEAGEREAWRRWAEAMAAIGLPVPGDGAVLSPEVAARLFDHDGLVERLADWSDGDREALSKRQSAAVDALAVCAAKVELWLLGYEVTPDGDPVLRRRVRVGRPGNWSFQLEETPASTALRGFFKDTELEGVMRFAPASRLKAELPEFFRRARELRIGAEAVSPEQDAQAIVASLEERLAARPGLWLKLRAAGAQMANTLFDGVRRAVAWVGRLLRGTAKALARLFEDSWLGNLWRVVRHFAGTVALRLRQAARVFCDGVSFLFSANQASDPVGQAVAARRVDFDLFCAIDPAAGAEVVQSWADGLVRRARHLGLATRMIALVLGAVRRLALSGAGGPLGWVPLVLGFARLYGEVRELGRDLAAVSMDGGR